MGTQGPSPDSHANNRHLSSEEEKKKVDDWLPITSSRSAKWWYSAFHNVTAMVGAGVLSLPYAMSRLGWGPGIAILILSWIITLYTLWQMVEMHEMVPGKRFDRYHELGQHAFGEKLGLWIVVPQQLIVEVGVNIVYMVTGGTSLKKFHDSVCPDCKKIKRTYFIMIFASVHFILSQLPNFNSISGVSLAAAVMSLSYSTIAWAVSVDKGKKPGVEYGYPSPTAAGTMFGFFNALGDVAFAYAGHNVVLEIQATIPSTPEKPSKKPMWRGVVVAYIIVALCYFPVALIGYWAFGNSVDDNILQTLNKPRWLIAAANMMVVIHVIGSYQIYAMPVFDMMETVLVKKLHLPPGFILRLIARSLYVAFTMFVGMTFPFFGGLLGFFGGFAFAPTTYFLPCVMWLKIYKPRRFSLSWIANWICTTSVILLQPGVMAGLSLQCGDCGALLKSVEEAQEHAEMTSHSNFSESTEAVLNLVCTTCGKPCRSKTETDLHTKRTGHGDFADKTLEAAKPIELEAPKAAASVEENSDGAAESSDQSQEIVVPDVDKSLLEQLESMGFPPARATRALHYSGNSSIEAAINWVAEHENDPDIDQMPMVPAIEKKESNKPSLTPEEVKMKAQELRERARKKKEEEEKRMEREREKERIRIGKELLEAKRIEEDNERKRILALRKAEKEEEKRAREKIRQRVEEDKAERRRKLGLPPEEPALVKSAPPVEEKKSSLPIRPATKAEHMRDRLRSLKQSHKDDDAKVKRAFQTLLTYVGNVARNPDEEKFRKIRLNNQTFQDRVGSLQGGIEFLELCGFEKQADGEFLFLPRDKVDMAVLNTAGSELSSAIANPFFGVL